MNKKSLILFILLVLLLSFLYAAIIFTYSIIALPHIVITWLGFDKLLKTNRFHSSLSAGIFALIPCFTQNLFICLIFIKQEGSLKFLITSFAGLILLIVSSIEFIVIRHQYTKFLTRA